MPHRARQTHALRTAETLRRDIASLAARLMAEDGIDDYGLAKRKAARQLGVPGSEALPGNPEIEEALREYQRLYQEDELQERLQLLRRAALGFMRVLERFHPRLTGPVLSGCAVRGAVVEMDVYADSAKEVEIFLLDRGVEFEVADHSRRKTTHANHAPETRLRVFGGEADFLLSVYPLVMERTRRRHPQTGQAEQWLGIDGLAELLGGAAT